VLLIDGNAKAMDEEGLARFVREQEIGLVGRDTVALTAASSAP